MTNKELIEKLLTAQRLLDEVHYWANYKEGDSLLPRNETVRDAMSVADVAIDEALVALDYLE